MKSDNEALSPLLRLGAPHVPSVCFWSAGGTLTGHVGLQEAQGAFLLGHPWASLLAQERPDHSRRAHGDRPSAPPVPDTWLLL